MNVQPFGKTAQGESVEIITLKSSCAKCEIITYGAALVSALVPDKDGRLRDVVLGFDSIGAYEAQDKFIGATIGRYANRIGGSEFSLCGQTYRLDINEAPNHLHGGIRGFDKRIWKYEEILNGVRLTLDSPHLECGYPGNLRARVSYVLEGSSLGIHYEAVSDRDTYCNLTNHSYFNLNGHSGGSAMGHILKLHSEVFTPVKSKACIPTGELRPVDGTCMDFRAFAEIGSRIDAEDEQLIFGSGYDHNWAVGGNPGTLRPAAEVYSTESGITLRVLTTMPGIQFYSGNFLNGCLPGKGGAIYKNRDAFCLETQYYPDSPNNPAFPQPFLKSGEIWEHHTVFQFGVV